MNLKGAFLKVNSQEEPLCLKIIPSVSVMMNYSSKSGVPEFAPVFSEIRITQYLVFRVMFRIQAYHQYGVGSRPAL